MSYIYNSIDYAFACLGLFDVVGLFVCLFGVIGFRALFICMSEIIGFRGIIPPANWAKFSFPNQGSSNIFDSF